jgi:hypothetical protein
MILPPSLFPFPKPEAKDSPQLILYPHTATLWASPDSPALVTCLKPSATTPFELMYASTVLSPFHRCSGRRSSEISSQNVDCLKPAFVVEEILSGPAKAKRFVSGTALTDVLICCSTKQVGKMLGRAKTPSRHVHRLRHAGYMLGTCQGSPRLSALSAPEHPQESRLTPLSPFSLLNRASNLYIPCSAAI